MLKRFRSIPLRHQLTIVIAVTCLAILIPLCVTMVTYEMQDYRRNMVRDTTVLADVIGENVQAALAFRDDDAATTLLTGFKAASVISAARIYDAKGQPFADYFSPGLSVKNLLTDTPLTLGEHEANNRLVVVRKIVRDGRELGRLQLHINLIGEQERVRLLILIASGIIIFSIFAAIVLSSLLQRLISGPILQLAAISKRIAVDQDQSLRAPVTGTNEVGVLATAFNEMMEQITAQNLVLQQEEVRIRSVLNAALSAVIVIDKNGKITDWSLRAEEMFGWERSAIIGQPVCETIFPNPAPDAEFPVFGLPANDCETARTKEITVKRKDGSLFLGELSVSTLQLHGSTSYYCGFITDITVRKQAELGLRAQMLRLDLLNRITHAVSVRQDLQSIFRVVIHSLEANLPIDLGAIYLFDVANQSLSLTHMGEKGEQLFVAPARLPVASISITDNQLERCLSGELIYEPNIAHVPVPFCRQLAEMSLSSLIIAPLMVDSAAFAVLVVVRKSANSFNSGDCEFIKQLSDHVALAAHQSQLYGALQQAYDDLRQTQQAIMQQERLRALGQMASGIAHDINNAIAPIGLYAEMMMQRETTLSERGRKQLEIINRSIDDVAHTVKRLGEFYRKSAPTAELTAVSVNDLVRQVLDLTHAKWSDLPQSRGIDIKATSELGHDLPPILAIASEIREALTNLVFNAVDAMPDGGTLTIRTYKDVSRSELLSTTTRHVCIDVIDTGTGMNEEARRRCLEPFYTTKGERGTGLGLAMVYGVLQRHHAELEIESKLNHGTTMRMCLPIAHMHHDHTVDQTQPEPGTPLRLLLIDDDPLILKSLRDALEGDGHKVMIAHGGREGIDACLSASAAGKIPDAVITDLGMPQIDGRQVAAAIKGTNASIVVIMLTGWGQRLLSEGDIPPHVDYLLSKPPKLHEIRRVLSQLKTHTVVEHL